LFADLPVESGESDTFVIDTRGAAPNPVNTRTETILFAPIEIRESGKYSRVEIPGCRFITKPGHPALPVKTVTVKLGLNDIVSQIVVDVTTYSDEAPCLVSPAPKASWNGGSNGTGGLTQPDPSIYGSDRAYPGRWFDYEVMEGIDPQTMRRVKYVAIQLYPVQYHPVSGELTICEQAEISILYEHLHEHLCEDGEDKELLEGVTTLPVGQAEGLGIYDLLIITSPALESYASRLADYKNSVGVSTLVMTTDQIYSAYSGRDGAEKIRNCIKDAVQSNGVWAVLILGDADHGAT